MAVRRSVDLHGDPGVAQLVVSIIFGFLATVAVVLRLVSRKVSKVYLSWNDHMILVALVCIILLLVVRVRILTMCQGAVLTMAIATAISVVAGGAGLHKEQLTSNELRIYWKAMFICILAWPVAQSTTKISILLFYVHLFPTKPFRVAAYSMIVVVSAWGIQQILASLFLCNPISFNWNGSIQGSCGDVAANCLAGAGINTLTDIIILILPMPIIWRLHVPLRQKVMLSLIFGLGSLICIISIIRLRTLFYYTTAPMMNPPYDADGPHDNSLPILYTIIESSLGVICACIIIMKPIFTHSTFVKSVGKRLSSWTGGSSSLSGSGGSASSSSKAYGKTGGSSGSDGSKVPKQDIRIWRTCEIDIDTDIVDLEAARGESGKGYHTAKACGPGAGEAATVGVRPVSEMISELEKR
ncbi:MAG: hypothetical protein Q9222_000428 [Ikaeria aurantiellina]